MCRALFVLSIELLPDSVEQILLNTKKNELNWTGFLLALFTGISVSDCVLSMLSITLICFLIRCSFVTIANWKKNSLYLITALLLHLSPCTHTHTYTHTHLTSTYNCRSLVLLTAKQQLNSSISYVIPCVKHHRDHFDSDFASFWQF